MPLWTHEMAPGLDIRWPPPTMLATEAEMVRIAVGRSANQLVGKVEPSQRVHSGYIEGVAYVELEK